MAFLMHDRRHPTRLGEDGVDVLVGIHHHHGRVGRAAEIAAPAIKFPPGSGVGGQGYRRAVRVDTARRIEVDRTGAAGGDAQDKLAGRQFGKDGRDGFVVVHDDGSRVRIAAQIIFPMVECPSGGGQGGQVDAAAGRIDPAVRIERHRAGTHGIDRQCILRGSATAGAQFDADQRPVDVLAKAPAELHRGRCVIIAVLHHQAGGAPSAAGAHFRPFDESPAGQMLALAQGHRAIHCTANGAGGQVDGIMIIIGAVGAVAAAAVGVGGDDHAQGIERVGAGIARYGDHRIIGGAAEVSGHHPAGGRFASGHPYGHTGLVSPGALGANRGPVQSQPFYQRNYLMVFAGNRRQIEITAVTVQTSAGADRATAGSAAGLGLAIHHNAASPAAFGDEDGADGFIPVHRYGYRVRVAADITAPGAEEIAGIRHGGEGDRGAGEVVAAGRIEHHAAGAVGMDIQGKIVEHGKIAAAQGSAFRGGYPDWPAAGPGGHGRADLGVGNHRKRRRSAVEGNTTGSVEIISQDRYRGANRSAGGRKAADQRQGRWVVDKFERHGLHIIKACRIFRPDGERCRSAIICR